MSVYVFLCEDFKIITLFVRRFDFDKYVWFVGKLRILYYYYKEMVEGNVVFTAYVLNYVFVIDLGKISKFWLLICVRGM